MLEKARQAKVLGSSLEARVLLHADDEALKASLEAWNQQPNTADPLRFMFIVSQVDFTMLHLETENDSCLSTT